MNLSRPCLFALTLAALPCFAACVAESSDEPDETSGAPEEEVVAASEQALGTHVITKPRATSHGFVEAPTTTLAAPKRTTTVERQRLVSDVGRTFARPSLTVNAGEVLDVTIDAPRIVNRAALGTRKMTFGDPETSPVSMGNARSYGDALAYARLRVDASYGDLYLVDCRVSNDDYHIDIQDVSGMGGGSQDIDVGVSDGHLIFAFDPGPGGYKQIYIAPEDSPTSWTIWGCEITPLEG